MITILSGAGMSAESGIRTFRDNNGLWEDHDVMDVASPQGWAKDSVLVNRFYNARRAQLKEVKPNAGHLALARLEASMPTHIITQNVDDLHERAGSKNVLHLHGELRKVRSCGNPKHVVEWGGDLTDQDRCPDGHPMRPHIVWFGEEVPALEAAIPLVAASDVVIVVGTSMQVYPAASLVGFAPDSAQVFYVDPHPSINHELSLRQNLRVIEDTAANALPSLVEQLIR
ncbi:MAG: NAD-dependent deacetylase [Saprospiraceae bacterium]